MAATPVKNKGKKKRQAGVASDLYHSRVTPLGSRGHARVRRVDLRIRICWCNGSALDSRAHALRLLLAL